MDTASQLFCVLFCWSAVKQYEESKLEKVKDSPVFNDRICLVYKNEFRKLKRGQIFIEAVKKSIA